VGVRSVLELEICVVIVVACHWFCLPTSLAGFGDP
jgi:hypothetical protein